MVIHGRIENGAVIVEGPIPLPDGTEVTIVVRAAGDAAENGGGLDRPAMLPEGARACVSNPSVPSVHAAPVQRPVSLPIFDYDGPPDIDLTNERIAEILDRDDASA